jgi:methylmalonyl-CoA mutase N-terminal domain/subunit
MKKAAEKAAPACQESAVDWDKYLESYYEKPKSSLTWSGLDVKEVYTPDDLPPEKYKEVGDPGQYPFTRGIHRNMFRGRYWTKREVIGMGSPQDTHDRLKLLVDEGGSGLNTIADVPYEMGLDADHPWAQNEVGLTGVCITNMHDMETMTADIPLDKVSWSLITATPSAVVTMAQYAAVARKRGYDLKKLRGTIQNDPVHIRYCGFRPATPLDLSIKTGADVMEFCTKEMPQWYYTTVNLYDLREQGITAPQEVAFGFLIARLYIDEMIRRGYKADDFMQRFAFYVSCHIDIFEEVSKIRAARRIWAKLMKEQYGAQKDSSQQFRFAVHTAGCSLVPQQPLNNIVRIAYQALAAVLGGVQSLHCCSYDEPVCLPTETGHTQALRTQQILAYETGVTNVSDPLGGSYYVENLTNKLEEEIYKIMAEVDNVGGMYEAIRTEWLDRVFEHEALARQKEIDERDKIIVGVNMFTTEQETTTPMGVQRISSESVKRQIEMVIKLKKERNQVLWKEKILAVRAAAERRENVIPLMIEATEAGGTTAEMLGAVRLAFGYSYDPLEIIQAPF